MRRTLLPAAPIAEPTSIILTSLAGTRNHGVWFALAFCLLCACGGTTSDGGRFSSTTPTIGESQSALLGPTLWSWNFGGTIQQDLAYARSVAVDPSGNTLLTGELFGTIFFNGPCASLSSGPFNANAYVAKFAPDGTCRWAHAYGDAINDALGEGVAVDSNGNVFVVGSFRGAMDFGCRPTLQNAAASHIFLAKLSPDGACRWAQEFGDGNSHHGHAVAVDNNGPNSAVVITGKSLGYVDFGGGWIGREGGDPGYDTYVAKFLNLDGPNDGLYQVASVYGATGNAIGRGIAVDNQHRVVVTGYFTGSMNFSALPGEALHSAGQEDIFVAKLNPDLSYQWSRGYGDNQPQYGLSVATDLAQNVVLTGGFFGNIRFDGLIDPLLSGRSGMSIFLITLYSNGRPRWAKQFGEDGDMSGAALATGPGNSVFLTGPFRGAVTFPRESGNITLRSGPGQGREDVFLAKFSSDLRNFDAKQFGSPVDTYSESVGLDSAGNVLLAGSFTGTMTFDSRSVTSRGGTDIFLSKMAHQCDGANCDGCCDGSNSCQVPSVQSCGSYGSRCFACDANKADSCVGGQCRCGSGPPCGDGLRCDLASHRCVCDASSCPSGCCNGGTSGYCQIRDRDHCAPAGQTCQACNPTVADSCLSNGTCGCGGSPACTVGATCSSGRCVCDQCGTYPYCEACTCFPQCGSWPDCRSCCPPDEWECCPGQCCRPEQHCLGP